LSKTNSNLKFLHNPLQDLQSYFNINFANKESIFEICIQHGIEHPTSSTTKYRQFNVGFLRKMMMMMKIIKINEVVHRDLI